MPIEELANMTNDELNALIDSIAKSSSQSTIKTTSATDTIKTAWLAAAQIARNAGYPCAATLVECSVYNIPYTESFVLSGGLFETKIKSTSTYKQYLSNVKAGRISPGQSTVLQFTKSVNADLFYSLHQATFVTTKSTMAGYTTYTVSVYDVFDFDFIARYDDLFTTLVNNWAWLCQQTNVLNPISVNITFLDT